MWCHMIPIRINHKKKLNLELNSGANYSSESHFQTHWLTKFILKESHIWLKLSKHILKKWQQVINILKGTTRSKESQNPGVTNIENKLKNSTRKWM